MKTKVFARLSVVLSGVILGPDALAQSIIYAPAASGIPTVSEWGLIVLSMAVAVFAYLALREKKRSRVVMAWVMSGAAAFAASGGWLMNEAMAIPSPSMSVGSGGTLDLSVYGSIGEFQVMGHPDVAMRIVAVTPTSLSTVGSPTCSAGLVVTAGGVCYVRFDMCTTTGSSGLAGAAC